LITIGEDPENKKRSLGLIMRKYGAEMELNYDSKDLDAMVLLKLTIESVTGKQGGRW